MTEPATSENYTIELTEKAAEVIHEAFEAEKVDKERAFVRVGAHAGGCSGYMYDMDFTEEAQPEDRVFESRGAFKRLHPTIFTTVGTACAVTAAKNMGQGIARELKEASVDAVLMVAT